MRFRLPVLVMGEGTKPEQQKAWYPPIHVRSRIWPAWFMWYEFVFRATTVASGSEHAGAQRKTTPRDPSHLHIPIVVPEAQYNAWTSPGAQMLVYWAADAEPRDSVTSK
jgi:hypothetical protein